MSADKEYVLKNQTLTKSQVYELYAFQKELKNKGFPDGTTTETLLEGVFATLSLSLGVISLLPLPAAQVPAALASAAFGIMNALSSSNKRTIANYLNQGKESLSDLYIEMVHDNISSSKADIAFYEFTDQKFRIVMDISVFA